MVDDSQGWLELGLFAQVAPASTSRFSGPMFQLEQEHVISENPNIIPRIGDLWILVAKFLLEGGAHVYKPKFKDRIKGGKVV